MDTIGTLITNLREERFMSKRDLAKLLQISESQLSRIESGKTATVSSDILAGLAKTFDVSTDYLLGLSPMRENTHLFSELRLSETACERLVRREIDGDTLSRLMEHEEFKNLIRSTRAYFEDSYAEGVSYRNAILDFGASFLRDHAHEASDPAAVRLDAGNIAQAETGAHEIELTAMRQQFMKILRESKDIFDTEQLQSASTAKHKLAGNGFSSRLREIAEEVYNSGLSPEKKLEMVVDRILWDVQCVTGLPYPVIKVLKPIYIKIIAATGMPPATPAREQISVAVEVAEAAGITVE